MQHHLRDRRAESRASHKRAVYPALRFEDARTRLFEITHALLISVRRDINSLVIVVRPLFAAQSKRCLLYKQV